MLTLHPNQKIQNLIPKIFMKKASVLIIAILLPLLSWGQAQINTKKMKISDFTQKITKVVLTGNEFIDSALLNEVAATWRVAPYEFCSLDEFASLKTSDEYYFLLLTNGQFKKEEKASIQFLSLVKGGSEAQKGIDEMLEVVSVPFASAQNPSGREMVFLPALLNIIQDFTLAAMEKDSIGYGGLNNHVVRLLPTDGLKIVFSEYDLCTDIDASVREEFFSDSVIAVPEEEADQYLLDNADDAVVSYVVAPSLPTPGAYCYKMLINTASNRLHYFKRHKITKKVGSGFLAEDLRTISASGTR